MGVREPLPSSGVSARGASLSAESGSRRDVRVGSMLPPYVAIYRAMPIERIEMIRRGIPAAAAKRLFADLAIGQGAALKALNLSTATVNKKVKQGDSLSPDESERVLGVARLLGQVEAIVEDGGDAEGFDAGAWLARWLTEPLPALGRVRPIDMLDTMEGVELVSTMLARIQGGAYG